LIKNSGLQIKILVQHSSLCFIVFYFGGQCINFSVNSLYGLCIGFMINLCISLRNGIYQNLNFSPFSNKKLKRNSLNKALTFLYYCEK
jgi:hypothetical protein